MYHKFCNSNSKKISYSFSCKSRALSYALIKGKYINTEIINNNKTRTNDLISSPVEKKAAIGAGVVHGTRVLTLSIIPKLVRVYATIILNIGISKKECLI